MAGLSDIDYGWTHAEIGVSTLSSNKSIYIHAGCYTASNKQQARIKIKRKGSSDYKVFDFGPESGFPFKDYGLGDYPVNDGTFYDVEIGISNDGGTGNWRPSTVSKPSTWKVGNFNETIVASEDLYTPDDINDTVIRLVWSSRPEENLNR